MNGSKRRRLVCAKLWSKTQGRCVYCGLYVPDYPKGMSLQVQKSGWFRTMDHMIPRAEKGHSGSANLLPACARCNNARGHAWPPSKLTHPDFLKLVLAKENRLRQWIANGPQQARTWVGKNDEHQAKIRSNERNNQPDTATIPVADSRR